MVQGTEGFTTRTAVARSCIEYILAPAKAFVTIADGRCGIHEPTAFLESCYGEFFH
jgi:hypothetical protein